MEQNNIQKDEFADAELNEKEPTEDSLADPGEAVYMEERTEEKNQILSFRSLCRGIVAVMFAFALIAGFYLISVDVFTGICVIVPAILFAILFEKLIDVVCGCFLLLLSTGHCYVHGTSVGIKANHTEADRKSVV